MMLYMYVVALYSALIYVVDSSDRERETECFNELAKLLQEKELKEASLLLLANKQVCKPVSASYKVELRVNYVHAQWDFVIKSDQWFQLKMS